MRQNQQNIHSSWYYRNQFGFTAFRQHDKAYARWVHLSVACSTYEKEQVVSKSVLRGCLFERLRVTICPYNTADWQHYLLIFRWKDSQFSLIRPIIWATIFVDDDTRNFSFFSCFSPFVCSYKTKSTRIIIRFPHYGLFITEENNSTSTSTSCSSSRFQLVANKVGWHWNCLSRGEEEKEKV